MRKAFIFVGLFVLFLGWRMFAQFGVVHQPMFGNVVTGQDYATNLAFRWVHTDLPTNVSFGSWTDHITQVRFLGPAAGVMTNTTNGVLFAAEGSGLTNDNGLGNKLFYGPTDTSTNWAMGFIFWLNLGTQRAFIGNANGFHWRVNTTSGSQLSMFDEGVNGFFFFPPTLATPDQWVDMVVASTNSGATALRTTWINGVLATNLVGGTQIPINFGIWAFPPAVPDTLGMRGYMREIWVATNDLTGARLDGMAADLHWVRTNIYQNP